LWPQKRSMAHRPEQYSPTATLASRVISTNTARTVTEALSEYARAAPKAAWARLIRKVYESDPLECPKCKGPMRVIALIEDPVVVRAILTHLGRWQPKALERAPPVPPAAWSAHASLPLTYHPVPDCPECPQASPCQAKSAARQPVARLASNGGHEPAAGG
jgi:hypothetical protein